MVQRIEVRRKAKNSALPVLITLGMVYLSWIYAQHVCWNEVYQFHSKATGIGLIIGNCLIVLLIYLIWLQTMLTGPGVQPRLPLFKLIKDERTDYRSIEPPEYFFSDINGYPIWCSTCESIKANRAHHSSNMKRCVAKFDHFCTMIGGSIGKKNYRLFIQFMFWCFSYFLYIGVSAAVYVPRIKERRGSVNGNLIVLFVAVLFWMIMLFALFVSHLTYIHKNISSIDDILAKRHRKQKTINDQFLNFAYNGERYVLRINPNTDYIWDKGFLKNWKEVMGDNVLFWIVPWGSSVHSTGDEEAGSYSGLLGDYNEEISEQWRSTLIERIKNGDYLSKS